MFKYVNCGFVKFQRKFNSRMLFGDVSVCASSSGNHTNRDVQLPGSRPRNVAEYYAGKKIFLTGGTGFLGKVLIERLLSNCPELDSIYVLIRQKKGQSAEARLKQMLEVPLFDQLKQLKPDSLNKLVPIRGDITEPELAISPEDERKLIQDVSVVFHSAATVKFTDDFDKMLNINLEGTQRVLDLGKSMRNLDTFLFISTAYSNGNRKVIEEVVYPPPKTLDEVYHFIKKHGDNQEAIDEFLGDFPNTYTFSKALSETLVDQERGNMKTIIFRPSIVTPSIGSPLPGWCDSWVGAPALFSDIARGLTKAAYGDDEVICDLIPVDYVSNLAIVAAARGNPSEDVIVYNGCSGSTNPITWRQAADLYFEESLKRGRGALKARKVTLTTSPLLVSFVRFTQEMAPAYLADLLLRLKGDKPRCVGMLKRSDFLRHLVRDFTSTPWTFKFERSRRLIDAMSARDKVQFPCDPSTIDWKRYMATLYGGVQRFLLKNNK